MSHSFVRRFFTLTCVVLWAGCSDAPPRSTLRVDTTQRSQGVIWQGFSQSWGYNHRLNSLGDWVGPVRCDEAGCRVEVGHSAASGSGADTARWQGRLTAVQADGVRFRQGVASFTFTARKKEGHPLMMRQTLLFADVDDPDTAVALLNGFDVYALDNADKLQTILIDVGPPEPTEDGGLAVEISVGLRLDCDSPECDGLLFGKFDRSVSYQVDVPIQLITAPADALAITPVSLSTRYQWGDHRDEPAPITGDDVRVYEELSPPAAGVRRVVGITGFSLSLDKAHHFSGWASQVELEPDHTALSMTMLFQQWNAGTVAGPLSYTDPIAARASLRATILDLSTGCVNPFLTRGERYWNANGKAADDVKAVTTRQYPILNTCVPPQTGDTPEVDRGAPFIRFL